jgi:hypothetical protein
MKIIPGPDRPDIDRSEAPGLVCFMTKRSVPLPFSSYCCCGLREGLYS